MKINQVVKDTTYNTKKKLKKTTKTTKTVISYANIVKHCPLLFAASVTGIFCQSPYCSSFCVVLMVNTMFCTYLYDAIVR